MSSNDDFLKISYWSSVKIARQSVLNALLTIAPKYAKGKLIDMGCGIKPYEKIFFNMTKL